jgi:hypothetical protein
MLLPGVFSAIKAIILLSYFIEKRKKKKKHFIKKSDWKTQGHLS